MLPLSFCIEYRTQNSIFRSYWWVYRFVRTPYTIQCSIANAMAFASCMVRWFSNCRHTIYIYGWILDRMKEWICVHQGIPFERLFVLFGWHSATVCPMHDVLWSLTPKIWDVPTQFVSYLYHNRSAVYRTEYSIQLLARGISCSHLNSICSCFY